MQAMTLFGYYVTAPLSRVSDRLAGFWPGPGGRPSRLGDRHAGGDSVTARVAQWSRWPGSGSVTVRLAMAPSPRLAAT